jgi:hypothetical protein
MNAKQQATLAAVFECRANINWREIESLFHALEAVVENGPGSSLKVRLNGVRAVFHRPHPQPQAHKKLVASVRKFLQNAGVTLP